ncbi:MAG TPA: cupredoxin domain-containing protein [Anaerolineales bacterium]
MTKKQLSFGVLFLLAGAAIIFAPLPVGAAAPIHRTFQVEASQFAYAPAVLQVNPGDTVTIQLASTDVVHGFYLDGYSVSVTADPGQTASLTFTADRSGTWRFRCNVTCGALHPFMVGKLQVGPDTSLWRAIALTLLAALAMLILRPSIPRVEAS